MSDSGSGRCRSDTTAMPLAIRKRFLQSRVSYSASAAATACGRDLRKPAPIGGITSRIAESGTAARQPPGTGGANTATSASNSCRQRARLPSVSTIVGGCCVALRHDAGAGTIASERVISMSSSVEYR
jgi:hypothetical protein